MHLCLNDCSLIPWRWCIHQQNLLPIVASEVYASRQVWYDINVKLCFFTLNRDAPLYLEWAPGNILSQNAPYENDASRSGIVGERDAKRMLLEQQVEGISDVDIDPDRVEVCHFLFVTHFYFFLCYLSVIFIYLLDMYFYFLFFLCPFHRLHHVVLLAS